MDKKSKTNDLLQSEDLDTKVHPKKHWTKPRLSFVGKLKDIVQGQIGSQQDSGPQGGYHSTGGP